MNARETLIGLLNDCTALAGEIKRTQRFLETAGDEKSAFAKNARGFDDPELQSKLRDLRSRVQTACEFMAEAKERLGARKQEEEGGPWAWTGLKAKVGELCKQVDAELWAEHDHTKQSRLAELANVLRPHFATFEEALTLAKAMFNGEIQAGPITFPRSVIGQELARIGQLMDNLKPDHNPHMDPTNRARTLVDIVIPQPAEEPSTEMATV